MLPNFALLEEVWVSKAHVLREAYSTWEKNTCFQPFTFFIILCLHISAQEMQSECESLLLALSLTPYSNQLLPRVFVLSLLKPPLHGFSPPAKGDPSCEASSVQ